MPSDGVGHRLLPGGAYDSISRAFIPFLPSSKLQIATFALRRIASIFDNRSPTHADLYSLEAAVTFTGYILFSEPGMSEVLWEGGCVALVCHIVRRLSSPKILAQRRSVDLHHSELSGMLFRTCLQFLETSMSIGGHPQIAECLENQLLLSMMKRRPFMTDYHGGHGQVMVDMGYPRILSHIEAYLLYPSILHLTSKSITSISKVGLHNWTSPHKQFLKEWIRFTSLVDAATISKSELLAVPYDWARCHNVDQGHCDPECSKLRVCSACTSVFYCSKKCQAEDWPSHQARCHGRQRSREIGIAYREGPDIPRETRGISRIGFTYIMRRVRKDIIAAREDRSLAANFLRQNPRANLKTLVLVLDYRETPHTTSYISEEMFRATEYKNLASDPVSDIEDDIAGANKNLGFLVFWVARRHIEEWKNFELKRFEDGFV
ncbi:hypothetical protein C8J56DRAFT_1170608 [Mycena floridula]|nr:hypothetical protein C8J56DRAFT_1170608 [Mycena floridula]